MMDTKPQRDVRAALSAMTDGRFDHSWDCSAHEQDDTNCDCWKSEVRRILAAISDGERKRKAESERVRRSHYGSREEDRGVGDWTAASLR